MKGIIDEFQFITPEETNEEIAQPIKERIVEEPIYVEEEPVQTQPPPKTMLNNQFEKNANKHTKHS